MLNKLELKSVLLIFFLLILCQFDDGGYRNLSEASKAIIMHEICIFLKFDNVSLPFHTFLLGDNLASE